MYELQRKGDGRLISVEVALLVLLGRGWRGRRTVTRVEGVGMSIIHGPLSSASWVKNTISPALTYSRKGPSPVYVLSSLWYELRKYSKYASNFSMISTFES